MLEVCPCKDCGERHESCHSDCSKYKEWKAEFEAHKSKILEQQKSEWDLCAEKRAVISRAKKRQYYSKK